MLILSAAGRIAPRPALAPLSPPPRCTERGGRQARLRIARAHSRVRAHVARARVPQQRAAGARSLRRLRIEAGALGEVALLGKLRRLPALAALKLVDVCDLSSAFF
jgi:hypothetical protein